MTSRIALLGLFSKDISHHLKHFYPSIDCSLIEEHSVSRIVVNSALEFLVASISKNEIHEFGSIWNELALQINVKGGCNGLVLFHSEFFESKLQIPITEMLSSVSGLLQGSILGISGVQLVEQNAEYWNKQLHVLQGFPLQMLNTISIPREMIEVAEQVSTEENRRIETSVASTWKEKLGSVVMELAQRNHPLFASLVKDFSSHSSIEELLSKYSHASVVEQSHG